MDTIKKLKARIVQLEGRGKPKLRVVKGMGQMKNVGAL
jgi:hypothetical protein